MAMERPAEVDPREGSPYGLPEGSVMMTSGERFPLTPNKAPTHIAVECNGVKGVFCIADSTITHQGKRPISSLDRGSLPPYSIELHFHP
jgi:hypothetical protein